MRIINFIINVISRILGGGGDGPVPDPTPPAPTPVPVPTPTPVPVPPDGPNDPLFQEIFRLINNERTKHGVHALKWDSRIQTATEKYAQLMARRDRLSHNLDGDIGGRLSREGYHWHTCGENIAWNQDSAQSVVQDWMNSPGHRRNILDDSYNDTGVAVANNGNGPYYCQDFGA